jgi:hypothetical protein
MSSASQWMDKECVLLVREVFKTYWKIGTFDEVVDHISYTP